MNWFSTRFFLLIFVIATVIAGPTFAAEQCRSLFTTGVEKVYVPKTTYNFGLDQLRKTISGKLATVWRSEWKTKLAVKESNQYVSDLVNHFLTPESAQEVLKGLNIWSEAFTRKVHARLYQMQTSGRLVPGDILAVRDKPAPDGAKDSTFTYYLKPLATNLAEGHGKHQVRIRTYLREIDFRLLKNDEVIEGFDDKDRRVTIIRQKGALLKVVIDDGKGNIESNQLFKLNEIIQKYGPTISLRAPHGKSYKLEIKTALMDEISGSIFELLAGDHMVQKLDVSLSEAQVQTLFAPLQNSTPQKQYVESMSRVLRLERQLIAKTPENKARIEAVLGILKEGLNNNPEFLVIEGATAYHRTAFETTTGLQTTIDREQKVFEGNMYDANALKKPNTVHKENRAFRPKAQDARHVELKVPVTSMQNTVGIEFATPESAPPTEAASDNDKKIKAMLADYHRYVRNNLHAGKFNYIRKNGDKDLNDDKDSDDEKPDTH